MLTPTDGLAVASVLCFFSLLQMASEGAPFQGSWADCKLAKQLYSLLETVPAGMAIAADCMFNSADMAGKIIQQLKTD